MQLASYHDSRYRTHIEINFEMVQEIYIQSFTLIQKLH